MSLYMINFIKNKALDQYLSQCPNNINVDITEPASDDVSSLRQCFRDLDTNMDTAVKTPRYGFADLCMVTFNMHRCLDGVYANVGQNPMLDTALMQMNGTRHMIEDFLRTSCFMDSEFKIINTFK